MSQSNHLQSKKSKADQWVELYISGSPSAKAEARALLLEEKRRVHQDARDSVDAEFAKIARSVG